MNETIKTMVTRGSCKQYKPEKAKKEDLDLVLQAGLKAPSGMNLQTPRFVVIQNDDVIAKIKKLNAAVMGADMDPFYGAPTVIAVLVKKECTYVYDGSIALANMLNAAHSLGMGARWIHRCKEVFESEEGKAFLKEWGVEDDVEGVGFMIIGYPDCEIVAQEVKPGRVFYVD